MKKFIMMATIAALASASQAVTLKEGTQEIVVSGLYDPEAIADHQYDLGLGYGKFIQDNVEVGGSLTYSENDLVDSYSLGVFGEYNWDLGNEVVPYVQVGLGYGNVDLDQGSSTDTAIASFEGGAKYFVAENVAISAGLEYDYAFDDFFVEDEKLSEDNWQINLGMRFFIP